MARFGDSERARDRMTKKRFKKPGSGSFFGDYVY
jgi:hypothetical protein